jgi:hypothetical protein
MEMARELKRGHFYQKPKRLRKPTNSIKFCAAKIRDLAVQPYCRWDGK